ncbi:MAG: preprotein translocase subunit SecY [Candidatus Andersenbacteria bacterium]|nr:preprotein translocase subunit SecY [Candidatus Andersenbacteria bacterium]MBI3251059.1 preprotein translocase subunit SecY [Candidatus Andersenbacteria bacterium]
MLAWNKVTQLFRIPELRKKILVVLGLLAVFRIAAIIPVPGVPAESLRSLFAGNQLFGLLDIFSGGGLSKVSILMLGVGPYITASIVMQLMTMIIPRLEEMQKEEGEAGRRKLNQWTRLLAVPLAALQGFAYLNLLQQGAARGGAGFGISFTQWEMIITLVAVTTGTIFLMWLGELITEQGIGNGISLIIFVGIISRLPQATSQIIATWTPDQLFTYGLFLAVSLIVIAGVVLVSEGQRIIPISYARRVRGGQVLGGASTHLPLRVNQAGVIPIIFALSVMLFPGVVANFFVGSQNPQVAQTASWIVNLFQNQLFYGIAYFVLVVAFTYFYTAVTFDPDQIAENVQKQGGFIPGIRPGKRTSEYLKYILNRITLTGAIFLGIIAVLPLAVQGITGISTLTIGGTALLIVVSVVLETMKQIESQLTMREYEGFLR